jgi:HEAT repeat protein
VLAATRDAEPARRQVAATLLADAPPEAAIRAWDRLLDDPSRAVRRSTVDAVAGVARQELRPLLERALEDDDAWTRWKALRGIGDLGTGPSRAAVIARASDPDFRVRLEAARVAARDRT